MGSEMCIRDRSGRDEVYIDTFPEPRGKKQISSAGGAWPQWGPGGRELFYISPASTLMAVSLKTSGDSVEVSPPHELFRLPMLGWAAAVSVDATRDGQRFLVLANREQAPKPLTLIVNWPALLKAPSGSP